MHASISIRLSRALQIALLGLLGLVPWTTASAADASTAQALRAILAVQAEGQGNAQAGVAWKTLAQLEPGDITTLLTAMDEAGPLALNWLRAAVETIAARARDRQEALPVVALGDFLLNTSHHPRARRLAYDLIAEQEPETARRLVPGLLNDPGVELRREAVQALLDQADERRAAGDLASATLLYRQGLGFARDVDQIQHCSQALEKQGLPVDLPRHFGFLMDWKVIGPFHNDQRQGFTAVFPPETSLDLNAQPEGKKGPVQWIPYTTSDPYGMVDLNKPLGSLKEVTAYALHEFHSDSARPAELRLGCKNAWKIWFNGQFLFGRDEYHRGAEIDQYRLPIQLQPGVNTILVKVCQNEQTEEWTKEWEFQIRLCDATGTAILSAQR